MTKIKGPKDGVLKVSFNGPAKTMPGTQKALMLLSIKGNELCSGEYLGLSLTQATDSSDKNNKISSLTILIADEIFWHNLVKSEKDKTVNQAQIKAEALHLGEEFIKSNLSAFLSPFSIEVRNKLAFACENKTADEQIFIINEMAATLPIPFEIKRWATWVNQKTQKGVPFIHIQNSIEELYKKEPSLIASIEATSKDFVKRHAKELDIELLKLRSKGYLTEESPAVMWLGAELGYNFVIYAGSMISAFAATKDFFVVDSKNQELAKRPFAIPVENSKNLVNWLEAYYRRVAAPKVAEKVKSVEALSSGSLQPAEKITPQIPLNFITPYTAGKTYNFGMFPPSPASPRERRRSRPQSLPLINDADRSVIKKQADMSYKRTTSLENELNPILLKAIMTIAQTLTDLPSEKERKTVIDLMSSVCFAELLCLSNREKPRHEVATQLRMS